MTILDTARELLRTSHPQARFTESRDSITVPATNSTGFDVTISNDLTVHLDGWHEHFETEDEAFACFKFGLSGRCRLEVTYRGNSACKWTLESLKDGQWVRDSTTALLLIPFWRRKRVVYLQNERTSAN